MSCFWKSFLILILSGFGVAEAKEACPVTLGAHYEEAPFPEFLWYRAGSLAVTVPPDGVAYTSRSPGSLSMKVFWWSEHFELGMESQLNVIAEHIGGNPNQPIISSPTNAFSEELKSTGPWAMLVGVTFEKPGCWRITGEFEGDKLSYVVKVKDIAEYRSGPN